MNKETGVTHPPQVVLPDDNHALVAPLYQSVKFEFDTLDETLKSIRGERPGFFYTRVTNPTLRQLELTLAQLQGREDCAVSATGVGVISQALLALTKQGDHVLCFVESYGPTRVMVRKTLARFGVRHTMLSILDLAGIERVLAEQRTRLVIFESPTNPTSRVADIAHLTRAARAHGALTLLDNTLAGPHQHGQYDIDLFLHSLTKYANGHGDVMGGAAIGSKALIAQLRPEFTLLGGSMDPHAAWLIQRGLRTYFVRYRAQSASALQVAQFLAAHPRVERVTYPGLPEHPQHALARAQMSDFGAVLSFDVQGGAAASRTVAEKLQLFGMAASLGSTDSLALPSQLLGSRDLTREEELATGVAPGTVRLSVGLENPTDLLADLQQALATL
jgi:cystathionine beta-lyase/cystathionine gamma-synthase